MAMSKKVDKYPAEFMSLTKEIVATGGQYRMDCGTEREAKALRFKLYGFANALREDVRNPRRTSEWDYLAGSLDGLELSVLREELIFTPRGQTATAKAAMAIVQKLVNERRGREKAGDSRGEDSQGLTDGTDLANEAVKRLYGLE